jgi:hypothetical protein
MIDRFELGVLNRDLYFKPTDFEAREDHTYSVEVTARRTDADGTTTSRNISRGNTKFLYGYSEDFVNCLGEYVPFTNACSKASSYLNLINILSGYGACSRFREVYFKW